MAQPHFCLQQGLSSCLSSHIPDFGVLRYRTGPGAGAGQAQELQELETGVGAFGWVWEQGGPPDRWGGEGGEWVKNVRE